jgi:hypothetical protein
MRSALLASLIVLAAARLDGQSTTGVPAVDSASLARSAWRRGQMALRARHDRNREPMNRGRVALALSDSTPWPEGVDYDPRGGRWYLATLPAPTR